MGQDHPPGQSDPAQGHLDLGDPGAERSLLAELLESPRLHHTGEDYLALLAFTARLPNFAPFNAMLLRVQKPGLTYAASAWDLFLGHQGPDKFLQVAPRPRMDLHQRELEAESLAYLVSKRHGVESNSYLADHVKPDTTIKDLDISVLLKAAGQVETALGAAAHTLVEPKAERSQGLPPQPFHVAQLEADS